MVKKLLFLAFGGMGVEEYFYNFFLLILFVHFRIKDKQRAISKLARIKGEVKKSIVEVFVKKIK